MSTNLLRKHTRIHHPQPPNAVHPTLGIDNAVLRRRPHARRADGVVQREGLRVHEPQQLLVGDVVRVAAGVRPPVGGWVVVYGDGFEVFLEGRAVDDFDADAEADEEDVAVVAAFVAEVFRVDNGWTISYRPHMSNRPMVGNLRGSKTSRLFSVTVP